MKTNKLIHKENIVFVGITAVLLGVLFAWHSLDVLDSIRECGDGFLLKGYLLLGLFLAGIAGVEAYLLWIKKSSLRIAIAAAVMLLGLANIFVFKGLSAPDEISHYISAYKLSNVMMMQKAADENGRVYVRSSDMFLEDMEDRIAEINDDSDFDLVIFGQTLDEQVYRIYEGVEKTAFKSKDETAVSCQWTVNTTRLAYVPQAIGISIARLLHFGPLGLISLGKLCNLLFFTGMIFLSLGFFGEGAEIIGGAAVLPMTLHLAGSMSYDVYVISMSFLFISLVLHMYQQQTEVKWAEPVGAAVVLALLGPCKIVYSFLIVLTLLLLHSFSKEAKGVSTKQFIMFVLLCIVLLCISMYLVNSHTIEDYAVADERVISWAEEPEGYTLTYLIHRPIETIRLVYRSFLMMTGYWFSTLFGIYMGNQDPVYNVPYPLIGMYAFGLFIIAAGADIRLNVWNKVICLGTFMLVFGALMGSMLLAYTPMSSPYIEGVQGRYLIPILPVALLCIPGEWISLKKSLTREMLWLFVMMDAYVLLRVYATVCLRL